MTRLSGIQVADQTVSISAEGAIFSSVSYVANPNRIVIDVPQASFSEFLPEPYLSTEAIIPIEHRYIQQIRYSSFNPATHTIRFVLDLKERASYTVIADGSSGMFVLQLAEYKLKIAIDAGHGPETAGKRTPDGSMREFQFNSVVARYVRDGLMNYSGVEVMFTHADDGSRDVPLKERTEAANAWGADLLVSIHANAMGNNWSTAKGIETYVYTTKPQAAVTLANAVQKQMILATGLFDRGVKANNLHMVREGPLTSILVESGFMTNKDEAALLKTDAYRRKCAQAVIAGLVEVYKLQLK